MLFKNVIAFAQTAWSSSQKKASLVYNYWSLEVFYIHEKSIKQNDCLKKILTTCQRSCSTEWRHRFSGQLKTAELFYLSDQGT